jgi:anti-sigma factor RsiW
MTCDEVTILLHALLDDELDAGNARTVEAHLTTCSSCAARLRAYRAQRQALHDADLKFVVPDALRRRVVAALPAPQSTDRRNLLKGVALGGFVSALAASGVGLVVFDRQSDQALLYEVTSAHLRSLQPGHLTDVETSDQHTVKPWFNGRVEFAPPVIDLSAHGFTLVGGRLDFLGGLPVACVVYKRGGHVINLFVAPAPGADGTAPSEDVVRGFTVRHWNAQGLSFWAISDIERSELRAFTEALRSA